MVLRHFHVIGQFLTAREREGCVCEYETVEVPASATPDRTLELVPNSSIANTTETVSRRQRVTAYSVKLPLEVKQKCRYCIDSQDTLLLDEEPEVLADIPDDDTVIFVDEPIDDYNDYQDSEDLNIRERSIEGELQEQHPSSNAPAPLDEDIVKDDDYGYPLQRFPSSE